MVGRSRRRRIVEERKGSPVLVVNQFSVLGRVARVDTKETRGGTQFSELILAVADNKPDGVVQMPVKINCWNKAHESCHELRRGQTVVVSGVLVGREGKDGHEGKFYLDAKAYNAIQVDDGKVAAPAAAPASERKPDPRREVPAESVGKMMDDFGSDVPF